MKEVNHDKGLYTEEEFNDALEGNLARQSIEDAKSKKEKVEDLAEMPLDGDDTLREGDKFISPDESAESTELSDEDARQITVITLMRIYDVLGAILNHLDEDQCEALLTKHANGELTGPLPSLNI